MPDPLRDSSALDLPGIGRREFLRRSCLLAVAAVGLPSELAARVVRAVENGVRPTVIWLSFQECTGCTETLLRTSAPRLDELLLDLINLEYHEALTAAAGHQAETSRLQAMERYVGQYVLVTEGAIPLKDDGIYCKIGGRTAVDLCRETAEHAAAVVAIGSCASWGGMPSSGPNPTGAVSVPEVLGDRTVVTIPGCPPNPYNFLGTVLQFATLGTLPELDELGRPKWAYGRTIHEDCPRRAHFDAGRFAKKFGDEGHRQGWCLYELGCKGPQTHGNCSMQEFNETPDAWPIGIGHPCYGCTEKSLAFTTALHATVDIPDPTPPFAFPGVVPARSRVSPLATGLGGAVIGGLGTAAWLASRKLADDVEEMAKEEG